MSKYKYTSLLSSEYRSVFKSYHSVERYERQKCLITSTNFREKSTNSQLKYSRNKGIYEEKHKFKTLNNNSLYCASKFQSKTDNLRKINTVSNEQHQSLERSLDKPFNDHQRLLSKIRNKYESYSHQNFYRNNQANALVKVNDQRVFETKGRIYQTIQNEDQIIYKDQISCKRPYIEYNTINHKNTELRMKVSEINKKRNDIKLKMRVNDIDQINRKYNYLSKQKNQNFQKNQYTPMKKMHESSTIVYPLQQVNSNKIDLKLQRKILENMTNKKILDKQAHQIHGQQNIQTPHFNNAETKVKQIDVLLIEKKLQNIVKNTFTDRY